jgi:transcriptional regulator with XRE-family HTH domain
MARKKHNQALLKGVAERLKTAFGDDKAPQAWVKLDKIVTQKSLWDYLSGLIMPGPEVLIKVAETYHVTIDWILTGEQTLADIDNTQTDELDGMVRKLARLGVAEDAKEYLSIMIEKQSRKSMTPEQEVRQALTGSLGLDTTGKRLKHLRESELNLSLRSMAKLMGITEARLRRMEADEIPIPANALTKLYAAHSDTIDLDWLLKH